MKTSEPIRYSVDDADGNILNGYASLAQARRGLREYRKQFPGRRLHIARWIPPR